MVEILANGRTLKPIFNHLAQPNPAPIYLHCTAGKDRTGAVIMLLFGLLGLPPSTIADEYALTNLGLGDSTPQLVELLLKNPNMGLDEEGLKRIAVAKKEYIEGLCQVLENKYGGAEQYFRNHLMMSAGDVEAIRKGLVVDERPIFPTTKQEGANGKVVNSEGSAQRAFGISRGKFALLICTCVMAVVYYGAGFLGGFQVIRVWPLQGTLHV